MLLQQPIFRRKKNRLMGRVCREECQHCTYVEVGQTSFSLTKKLVNAIFVVSGRGKKLLRQAVYEIGGFPSPPTVSSPENRYGGENPCQQAS